MKNYHDIVLALAGIVQASSLVYELANHGSCNQEMFEHSISSIYKISSNSVAEIFGNDNGVKLGLVELTKIFNQTNTPVAKDCLRYCISILALESQLQQQTDLTPQLRTALEKIVKQVDYFGPFEATVIANLASVYSEIFGNLKFRIMVHGKEEYLQQDDVIQKIRALLLAGIRAAVLWRQVGGNKFQILFQRKKLIAVAQNILREI